MTDEFTPIKRASVPEAHASFNGVQVNVTLSPHPNTSWIDAFKRADHAQQGVRHSKALRLSANQPSHPGLKSVATVWFEIASDDDLEPAVTEVDKIISRANDIYTRVILPEAQARQAAKDQAERAVQERQAALTERASRLAPPA